jgi:O-antigen ligase
MGRTMLKKKLSGMIITPHSTLLWPPSIKVPSTLISLALMTTLTPITGSYTFLFCLLLWLTLGLRSYALPLATSSESHPQRIQISPVENLYRQYIKPFNFGIAVFAGLQILSAIGAYLTSEFDPSAKEILKTTWHLVGKWLAIWIVLSQSIAILLRYNWNPRSLLKPFLAWFLLYAVYCFAQRIWGLDWVRGIGSVLGPHRFAYGVYRISGFMSHPLTLTYNLMTIFFLSFCLSLAESEKIQKTRDYSFIQRIISWKSVAVISASILIASGSRFVLLVIPPALILSYIRPFREFFRKKIYLGELRILKKILFFGGPLLFAVLILGKSSLNRFNELFDSSIPWHDRWPRLFYWEIHWELFLSHPIFGTSVAKVSEAAQSFALGRPFSAETMNAHNLFLQFLADSGLVGFFGLCILLGSLITGSKNKLLTPIIQSGMISIVLGLIGSSISQNVLRDSEFVFTLWISLAILMAYSSIHSSLHTDLQAGHDTRA